MTKKLGRLLNKRVLLGAIIGIVIAGLAGGAYYFYTQNQKQQAEKATEQKKTVAAERSKLDDAAFRGDRDIAAEYTALSQANDLDAAYKIYVSAAQKLTENTAKIALYEQAVATASRAKQSDHAIQYAVILSDLANNYRASANAAYLYGANKDYENQKKYLQKAISQLESVPKESAEYNDMKAYYEGLLAKVGAN